MTPEVLRVIVVITRQILQMPWIYKMQRMTKITNFTLSKVSFKESYLLKFIFYTSSSILIQACHV